MTGTRDVSFPGSWWIVKCGAIWRVLDLVTRRIQFEPDRTYHRWTGSDGRISVFAH